MQTRLPVRSYVLRGGRLTPAQARALDVLWPAYGISPEPDTLLQFPEVFGREAPVVLDIGFGNGESVLHAAKTRPEENILGIEVHQPGVGALLNHLHDIDAGHVRIIQADAVDVMQQHIAPESLAAVRVFFPDPWPKKRHHKRRLVQPEFVSQTVSRLTVGGLFHLATDWVPYAQYMLETLNQCADLTNQSATGDYVPRPAWRPVTRFERRGLKYDQPARDLLFMKRA